MFENLKHKFKSDIDGARISMHEEGKINVFLNTLFIGFLIGFLGTFVMLSIGAWEMIPLTVLSTAISVITFFIAIKTSSYKVPAFFFFLLWFTGVSFNIIYYDEVLHFASPIWIILINILVIYVLGIRIGFITLFISTLVFIFYLKNELAAGIERMSSLNENVLLSVYVEAAFAMASLGFLLWIIIENSRKSDIVLNEKNQKLEAQNAVILQSNEEKTIMLKEIHHRVKNNLQIITSLLRLQMNEIQNDEAIAKFRESINRVIAMSLIHEKIYQSDQLNQIDIREYFQSLGDDLIQSYATDKPVNLNLHMAHFHLPMEKLIPLALMFNELMTNSLKHAFENTELPEIHIELTRLTENRIEFIYADNGIWVQRESKSSLGIELIHSFAEQLDGNIEFESEKGTRYRLIFPN
jgi:two-component system, sensor histidine kinase PdtaS